MKYMPSTARSTAVFVLALVSALAAEGSQAPQTPDFSGRWQLEPMSRSASGGPSTTQFAAAWEPPQKADGASSIQRAVSEAVGGFVSLKTVIGTDGKVVDIEPLFATVWTGQATALLRTILETERRQSYRPGLLNNAPIPSVIAASSQAGTRPGETSPPASRVPHEITINQSATTLTSRRETPLGPEVIVLDLGGKPGTTRFLLADPSTPEWQHASKWEGARLVTTTAATQAAGLQSRIERRFFEADKLIVETIWPTKDGVAPIIKRLIYTRMPGR